MSDSSQPRQPDPKPFRQKRYVDGQRADADGSTTVDIVNPATQKVMGTVPRMGGV